ncbi:MAG: hypothetical protein AAF938_20480, partial [Myxococcota bacterium]
MTRLCLLCLLIATAGCGTMNMEFVDDAGPSMDAAPNARTDPWTRFADTPYVDGRAACHTVEAVHQAVGIAVHVGRVREARPRVRPCVWRRVHRRSSV